LDEKNKSPQSCSHQMQFGKFKLNLQTLIGFQEIKTFWIDFENFTTQTRTEIVNFPTNFIEFGLDFASNVQIA